MTLTRELFRLVSSKPISDSDLQNARYYVLDWLGSYLAGGVTPQGKILRRYDAHLDSDSLLQRTFKTGALSHITETDDLHRASVTHPACVVIPVALQLARHLKKPAEDMLRSVLIGYEIMLRVGESLGTEHYKTFHNTSTAGVFGAAASAAALLDLDEEQWVWALGNAGTQAFGLWQFNLDATMSKHLHAGQAAEAGLKAALLAKQGFTGTEEILEGEKGFYRGFCRNPIPDAVLRTTDTWKIAETSIKPYPSCRHTHPAIDAALTLRELLQESGKTAKDIASIDISTYQTSIRVTDNSNPLTTFAAKFSIQYCVSTALVFGYPQLQDFEGEVIHHRDIRKLMSITHVSEGEEFENAYPSSWGSSIRLSIADGTSVMSSKVAAKGDPEQVMDLHEIRTKVFGQMNYANIPSADHQKLWDEFGFSSTLASIPKLYWD